MVYSDVGFWSKLLATNFGERRRHKTLFSGDTKVLWLLVESWLPLVVPGCRFLSRLSLAAAVCIPILSVHVQATDSPETFRFPRICGCPFFGEAATRNGERRLQPHRPMSRSRSRSRSPRRHHRRSASSSRSRHKGRAPSRSRSRDRRRVRRRERSPSRSRSRDRSGGLQVRLTCSIYKVQSYICCRLYLWM